MNTTATNPILSAEDIARKIRRMAFEVAERNADCSSLIIAGVAGNGVVVAKNVIQELKNIISCSIEFVTINIDKQNMNFDGKTVILVDDVANSGKVLLYSLKPFIAAQPTSIQTLVLIERSHKLFPIHSDYVGLSIATTLREHITVRTEGGAVTGAWLH
jgi:pyrimidine operon attenuation protein / uracil phosphoribosyltransferase